MMFINAGTIEVVLRALFKFMGVSDTDMREAFEKGHALVVDGSSRIATIDKRLERIERALNISATIPQIEGKSDGESN